MAVSPEATDTDADFGISRKITIAPQNDGCVFALRGIPRLKPKNVFTGFYPKEPGYQTIKSLNLGGRQYRISEWDGNDKDAHQTYTSEIDLRCGRQKQVVSTVSSKFDIYVVWAGDLDGDGKLDLYVRREFNNFRVSYTLYLSSYAHRGDLVGQAAEGDGTMIGLDHE